MSKGWYPGKNLLESREKNLKTKQDAKTERNAADEKAKEEAYKNKIDPNAFKADRTKAFGDMISNVADSAGDAFEAKFRGPQPAPAQSGCMLVGFALMAGASALVYGFFVMLSTILY